MKICETSLRWILNIRKYKDVHKYNLNLIEDMDGHSMNSMLWTIKQCKIIDTIGLERWFELDDAKGYTNYLSNQNGFYRSSIEITSEQFKALTSKYPSQLK